MIVLSPRSRGPFRSGHDADREGRAVTRFTSPDSSAAECSSLYMTLSTAARFSSSRPIGSSGCWRDRHGHDDDGLRRQRWPPPRNHSRCRRSSTPPHRVQREARDPKPGIAEWNLAGLIRMALVIANLTGRASVTDA